MHLKIINPHNLRHNLIKDIFIKYLIRYLIKLSNIKETIKHKKDGLNVKLKYLNNYY